VRGTIEQGKVQVGRFFPALSSFMRVSTSTKADVL
jgi:hypothetical protein